MIELSTRLQREPPSDDEHGPQRVESTTLGQTGQSIGRIGLGCYGMASVYGPADDDACVSTIHRALDLGMCLLDVADIYGAGSVEELVGRAVKGRDEAFVTTKFGYLLGPHRDVIGIDASPQRVREACDASLSRLQREPIDLYILHEPDPRVPIAETVGAMSRLVESGKVRFLGLSKADTADIRVAVATHPIAAVQVEYSLWTRQPEAELLALTRQLGIALIAYSPLSRGLLTGRVRNGDDMQPGDTRPRRYPRFRPRNLERNIEAAAALSSMAADKHCSIAQLALAWLLAQGSHVIPIPGAKRPQHVEENAGTCGISLTNQDLQRLEEVCRANPVADD